MGNQEQDFTQLYDDDIEKAVLGALIIESGSFYDINDVLQTDMFHNPVHQKIYETIKDMHNRSIPVDMVTISKEVSRVDKSINAYKIVELTDDISSAAHIKQHALYLKQGYLKRESLKIYLSSIKDIISGIDIGDILNKSIISLNNIDDSSVNSDSLKPIKDFALASINEAETRTSNFRSGKINGIPTFSEQLDKITGGWHGGDLIIIAARPAMGKTAIALKTFEVAAFNNCNPSMWALEMKGERLIDRMILEKTGIEDWRYKQGKLTDNELALIENTSNYFYSLAGHIDDCSSQTIARIKSKARILKKKGLLGLIIIDYLQLTEGDGKSNTRNEEVSTISRELKKMAKDLDVPVIALSQLNRAVESRGGDKRPLLADLRDSGSIEQDADMVLFIHRPDYYGNTLFYDKEKTKIIANGIEIIIAKYREGATGSVFLQHDGSVRNIRDFQLTPF